MPAKKQPAPVRPVVHTWDDVDRLLRVSRGEMEDGDADALAELAARLRRQLPKRPPEIKHLRVLRMRLGRMLGLVQRNKSIRWLPLKDFSDLLGIGTRQLSRYLAGTVEVTNPKQLAVLRELWRRSDEPTDADVRWLRRQIVRAIPLRTRRERKAHEATHLIPSSPPPRGGRPAKVTEARARRRRRARVPAAETPAGDPE